MKISDNTAISMPMRNLLSIVAAVAVGVWAYFGVIERLNNLETKTTLDENALEQSEQRIWDDLEKNTEFRIKWPRGEMGSLPADSEQFMLIEHIAGQLDKIQERMEAMLNNGVNITRLQEDVKILTDDVEKLPFVKDRQQRFDVIHSSETDEKEQRDKLVKILAHDVERIERLITDYSQMLKDEVALSKEKMKVINLKLIAKSVVDDFNNIYESKRGIKIELVDDKNLNEYLITGIENRIEQIIANLLDNSISFSADNEKIKVKISKNLNNQIILNVIDEGEGFKEKDTDKIFKRFYSNRPETFGCLLYTSPSPRDRG